MAVKHKKQRGVLVCSVKAGVITKKEQRTKTPHVRVFGKLTPIKESEIPDYERANFKIDWI